MKIRYPEEVPTKPVSDTFRRNVFLAVKEAITNITKYASAKDVQVNMMIDKRQGSIEITDNGKGFEVQDKKEWGNGLVIMNDRMKEIRGTFRIESEIAVGTRIKLTFPV